MSRRYRSLLLQWVRQSWRRPAPTEIEPLMAVAPSQVAVTRAGHSTMLIRYHNLTVITDPLLTRFCKGVARRQALGLKEKTLEQVELVLISSTASDHLHRPSLQRLPKTATVVLPRGAGRELAGLDFERVVELRPGQGFSHRGVEVATVAGVPDSTLYCLRGEGPSVFYCGQSGMTEEFAALGESHAPDVALLPIGSYLPKSFRRRNLTPATALDAFESLRARVFVPHRYGDFAFSYEKLDDPLRWLTGEIAARGLERYLEILETGETQLLVPPRGRAVTKLGQVRRPIGRPDEVSGEINAATEDSGLLDFEIDEGSVGSPTDSSYDEIAVDGDVLTPDGESLPGG